MGVTDVQQDSCQMICKAAKCGDLTKLKDIISRGGCCNSPDTKNGWSALMFAASGGHLDVVTYLIERGADTNATSDFGHTALHLASARGHYECVKYLLKFSKSIDTEAINGSALSLAVLRGHRKVAELLLEAGCDARSGKTLRHAIVSSNINILHWLLTKMPENSTRSVINGGELMSKVSEQAPIHVATVRGNTEAVTLLLYYGADCNATDQNGKIPLSLATANNDIETLNCLLDHKDCDINRADETPRKLNAVHVAAHMGHEKCLRILIDNGANINNKDAMSVSPLLHAISTNRLTCASILVTEGCKLDCIGQLVSDRSFLYRTTPLELALRKGHAHLANMLISAGCKTSHLSPGLIHSRPWLKERLSKPQSLMDLSRVCVRRHLGLGLSKVLPGLVLPPGLKALLLLKDLSLNICDGEPVPDAATWLYTYGITTSFDHHMFASAA